VFLKEATNWFANHPLVLKSGIGVVGLSKGAGLAAYMAVKSDLVSERLLNVICGIYGLNV
jgi:hypothetical protein